LLLLAVATDALILHRLRNLWARSGLQVSPEGDQPVVKENEHVA
jgi:hypothetical protein